MTHTNNTTRDSPSPPISTRGHIFNDQEVGTLQAVFSGLGLSPRPNRANISPIQRSVSLSSTLGLALGYSSSRTSQDRIQNRSSLESVQQDSPIYREYRWFSPDDVRAIPDPRFGPNDPLYASPRPIAPVFPVMRRANTFPANGTSPDPVEFPTNALGDSSNVDAGESKKRKRGAFKGLGNKFFKRHRKDGDRSSGAGAGGKMV